MKYSCLEDSSILFLFKMIQTQNGQPSWQKICSIMNEQKIHLDSDIDNNYTTAMLRNRYQRIRRGVAKGRYSYQTISIRLSGQYRYSSNIPIAIYKAVRRQLHEQISSQTDDIVYSNHDSLCNHENVSHIHERGYTADDACAKGTTDDASDTLDDNTIHIGSLPLTAESSPDDCLQDPLYLEFCNLIQPSYPDIVIYDVQV